jgi:spore germination protein GerM
MNRERRSGAGRLWWTLAVLSLALALAMAFLFWYFSRGAGDETLLPAVVEARQGELAGTRGVVLIFSDFATGSVASEQRELPTRDRLDEDLRSVVEALLEGPTGRGACSTVPSGTRLLGVYLDATLSEAALDFSAQLVTGHPGGTTAELATLSSVLGTVAWNFPRLRTCTLLVDGAPVETLGGHVAVGAPFELRRWR